MNQHARSSKSQSERQYSGSKRRAAVANYAFGLGQAAFVAVTGIVLVPMYLSHMSLAMYGAWLATGNIITLISVL
jgi:uncharacterized membrane protein